MVRICLCLLFALASATVAAREVKLSSPGSEACPEARSDARHLLRANTAPVRETRAKPSVHGDAPSGAGRAQTPRWHSFLPGMIR